MELLALVAFLAAIVLLERGLYRRRGLKNVDYTCGFSVREAWAGDTIELTEIISNRKWLPLPWLKAEISTSKWLDFAGSQSLVTEETRYVPSFFLLRGYHRVTRRWRVQCLKRGVFPMRAAVLVATDLLGGVSISRAVETGAEITVLPKPFPLSSAILSPDRMTGEVVVRRHLVTDPFQVAGVRPYAAGDTLTQIHWLSTARMGNLMVRNNEYTRSQNLTVLLNMQSRSSQRAEVLDPGRIEFAIRICASIFDAAAGESIPLRFGANGGDGRKGFLTGESWGREHALELMRVLAALPLRSAEDFSRFLTRIGGDITSTDIILVSAHLDEELCAFARERALSGARVTILLADSGQTHLPGDLEIHCLREEDTADET